MSTDDFKKYKYRGWATATVTLEVPVHSSWGGDCTVAQIVSQATDEVEGLIHQLAHTDKGKGIRIVGKPNITAVMATKKADE